MTAFRTEQAVVPATEEERAEMTGGFVELLESGRQVPVFVDALDVEQIDVKTAWEKFQEDDWPEEQYVMDELPIMDDRDWCKVKDEIYGDERLMAILADPGMSAFDQSILIMPKGTLYSFTHSTTILYACSCLLPGGFGKFVITSRGYDS
jgi:hypothetical protein